MKIKFGSLPYIPLRITSPFGRRDVSGIQSATSWHDGVDIGRDKKKYSSAPAGNVLAVMDGVITNTGYNNARGYYIIIKHNDIAGRKVETLYQHLFDSGISQGTKVVAGQAIGKMGQSGVGNGIHLHFELRVDGKCIDPLPFLKSIDRQNRAITGNKVIDKRLYNEFQAKYNFSDDTMKFFITHPLPNELFRKCLNNEPLQSSTTIFIRKNKYGNEILDRIRRINESSR